MRAAWCVVAISCTLIMLRSTAAEKQLENTATGRKVSSCDLTLKKSRGRFVTVLTSEPMPVLRVLLKSRCQGERIVIRVNDSDIGGATECGEDAGGSGWEFGLDPMKAAFGDLLEGVHIFTAELRKNGQAQLCSGSATVHVLAHDTVHNRGSMGWLHSMVADRPDIALEAVLSNNRERNSIVTAWIHPAAAFCGGGFGAGTGRETNSAYMGRPVAYDHLLISFARDRLFDMGVGRSKITMVDVGANTGCFTLLAVELGHLFVRGFEPVFTFSRILEANVRLNKLSDRVSVEAVAVTNQSGMSVVSLRDIKDGGLATLSQTAASRHSSYSQPVPTALLDDILDPEEPVDLLKIDVEGHESAVIAGGQRTLRRWKPAVLFEMSQVLAQAGGYHGHEAVQLLLDLGYGIAGLFSMGPHGYDVYMVHGWKGEPRWTRAGSTEILEDASVVAQVKQLARESFPQAKCFRP